MSTDLYGVRVEALSGDTATLRVFQTYLFFEKHAGRFHLDRTLPYSDCADFFVRVLLDHVEGRRSTLHDVITRANQFDENWLLDHASQFVTAIVELSSSNRTIDDPSGYAGFYNHRDGGWPDEERLPSARYEITVADASWLTHLKVGDSWGTTSYFVE